MSYRIFLIATLVLLMGFSPAQSQTRSRATEPGASLISGMLSFSSQGGDLYDEDGNRLTTIAIAPSLFHFFAPGVGIGGDLSYTRMSIGDDVLTSLGVGPKLGYFIDSGGKVIPFISGGMNFLMVGDGDDSENGLRFKFGAGILVRNGHVAVAIEAGYIIDRFKYGGASEATTGNMFVIGVGFAGFSY